MEESRYLLDLSRKEIEDQLITISQRSSPEPGRRQVGFTSVEILLCYGLFFILDPHRYGGANIEKVPQAVKTLARFFQRSSASITNKMLNLDGSRLHSAKEEPQIFAYLADEPKRYVALYKEILTAARHLSIGNETLPDFLGYLSDTGADEELLGQEELPESTGKLLAEAESENELQEIELAFSLQDRLTEKLVERKIRLAQHRFALDVLDNCGRACVFCGFEPRSLPRQSGLLRASHIKPWRVSNHRERVDVRNGLAACPIHDAAFDQGYLTVNGGYRIHKASILQESIAKDRQANLYFSELLVTSLLLPAQARRPAEQYLAYHREKIFKGME